MISFLFIFLLTYEQLGEHGCRLPGQPGHRTTAGMERRRRTAAREGKAGRRDARCARRLRACSYGNGVHNDEHVGVHYYMILWLHGEVEEDGRRLCASLTGERLGLELVMVELRP